jgi:hypothetical protein
MYEDMTLLLIYIAQKSICRIFKNLLIAEIS